MAPNANDPKPAANAADLQKLIELRQRRDDLTTAIGNLEQRLGKDTSTPAPRQLPPRRRFSHLSI